MGMLRLMSCFTGFSQVVKRVILSYSHIITSLFYGHMEYSRSIGFHYSCSQQLNSFSLFLQNNRNPPQRTVPLKGLKQIECVGLSALSSEYWINKNRG